jgi:hypothetical protein
MTRRAAPLVVVLVLLVGPAAALGQGSPFTPLPPAAPQTTQAPVQPTNPQPLQDKGLAGWQKILIFAGAAIVLGGIGYAIVSDARRRAPVQDRFAATDDRARDPHRERAKQRARSKQKQARAQRKRNVQRRRAK